MPPIALPEVRIVGVSEGLRAIAPSRYSMRGAIGGAMPSFTHRTM
jgi:hypothetical protein